jgi:ribosomal protein L29
MSKKIFDKIKSMSSAELKSRAGELEEQLFRIRIQKVTGQTTGYAQVWKMRKELARVLTAMTQKASG